MIVMSYDPSHEPHHIEDMIQVGFQFHVPCSCHAHAMLMPCSCHAHACPDWSIWPWELKHTGSRCKRLSQVVKKQISTASSPAVPGDCRRAANALNSSAWQTVGHGLHWAAATPRNCWTNSKLQNIHDYTEPSRLFCCQNCRTIWCHCLSTSAGLDIDEIWWNLEGTSKVIA